MCMKKSVVDACLELQNIELFFVYFKIKLFKDCTQLYRQKSMKKAPNIT